MAANGSLKSQVIQDYLTRFPNAYSKTIANLIYKENPSLWSNVEAVRRNIRYWRGSLGKKHRQSRKGNFMPKPNLASLNDIPNGQTDIEDWGAYEIKAKKVLVISDIHVPYHDKRALKIALTEGVRAGCETCVIAGDLCDIYSLSCWEKDPRKRNFADEIKKCRQVLKIIRGMFKQVIYKQGNHEERFERYMMIKAPELLGLPDFEFENVLGLREMGIPYIKDKRPLRLHHLRIIHGHEFGRGIFSPVNPARGFYMAGKQNVIGGDRHQTSEHSETTLDGPIVSCWSIGCLCDMHPSYRPVNKWNLGFAIVDARRKDRWKVRNHKIINGCVV